jgi:hypothetical protein
VPLARHRGESCPVRGVAPLNSGQFLGSDSLVPCPEPGDLGEAELRVLVERDAGGLVPGYSATFAVMATRVRA